MKVAWALLLFASRSLPISGEWDAAEALREYMRNKDPLEEHGISVASLRGSYNVDEDLKNALHSPRLSTVQVALEHAIKQGEGYDKNLYRDVETWFKELERRMATLNYCKKIRGQGWDGECLTVDNWWNKVKHLERMEKPWTTRNS